MADLFLAVILAKEPIGFLSDLIGVEEAGQLRRRQTMVESPAVNKHLSTAKRRCKERARPRATEGFKPVTSKRSSQGCRLARLVTLAKITN